MIFGFRTQRETMEAIAVGYSNEVYCMLNRLTGTLEGSALPWWVLCDYSKSLGGPDFQKTLD